MIFVLGYIYLMFYKKDVFELAKKDNMKNI